MGNMDGSKEVNPSEDRMLSVYVCVEWVCLKLILTVHNKDVAQAHMLRRPSAFDTHERCTKTKEITENENCIQLAYNTQ